MYRYVSVRVTSWFYQSARALYSAKHKTPKYRNVSITFVIFWKLHLMLFVNRIFKTFIKIETFTMFYKTWWLSNRLTTPSKDGHSPRTFSKFICKITLDISHEPYGDVNIGWQLALSAKQFHGECNVPNPYVVNLYIVSGGRTTMMMNVYIVFLIRHSYLIFMSWNVTKHYSAYPRKK